MGGCASTNAEHFSCLHQEYKDKPVIADSKVMKVKKDEFHEQYHSLLNRISDYEQESCQYLDNLYLKPVSLLPEELKDGYISANAFFNIFHAGFCAPYIANPNYMLLVDFRSREEYETGHIVTATHFESFSWDMLEFVDMCAYSVIVFYDQDGTAAANVLSVLNRALKALRRKQVETLCILGGIKSIQDRFPHLTVNPGAGSNRLVISWMPTLIRTDRLFLGKHEQAEEQGVIDGLRLTHILSIGRSPESRFDNLFYFGLDGERDLMETLDASFTIINAVVSQNGRIMVHGVEGLNRSAAVVISYLMQSTPCTLEDAFFYIQVLRPFIRLDEECLTCLLQLEKQLFGSFVTDVDELWM